MFYKYCYLFSLGYNHIHVSIDIIIMISYQVIGHLITYCKQSILIFTWPKSFIRTCPTKIDHKVLFSCHVPIQLGRHAISDIYIEYVSIYLGLAVIYILLLTIN